MTKSIDLWNDVSWLSIQTNTDISRIGIRILRPSLVKIDYLEV
jgi:hypothetical protein